MRAVGLLLVIVGGLVVYLAATGRLASTIQAIWNPGGLSAA